LGQRGFGPKGGHREASVAAEKSSEATTTNDKNPEISVHN
jgi:hypothetical protein